MSTRLRVITLAVLSVALPAQGEDSLSGLSVGARVRLTAPSVSSRPLVGKLVRQHGTAFEISQDDGSSTSVSISSIAKLQVSSGKKRNTLVGAFGGAALGVGITLIALRCQHTGYCEDTGGYIKAGLVVLGGGGAAIGAVVGTLIRTEQWTTVPVPAPRPDSAPGGTALSFTLRF